MSILLLTAHPALLEDLLNGMQLRQKLSMIVYLGGFGDFHNPFTDTSECWISAGLYPLFSSSILMPFFIKSKFAGAASLLRLRGTLNMTYCASHVARFSFQSHCFRCGRHPGGLLTMCWLLNALDRRPSSCSGNVLRSAIVEQRPASSAARKKPSTLIY